MKCIIYSRVSTEVQDNERQINELKAYAAYKKYDLIGVFEEKVTGAGKATERIEFARMLDFIEHNDVNCVMVWELSRLGRKTSDVLNTIENFADKKINIYCHKEGINTLTEKGERDPITNLITSVLSSFAELERVTTKQRSKSGIRQNVLNGGSGTGIIKAYGFKKEGKKLVIDQEEAKIVKLIFQKYLEGLGTKQLANYLNQNNIPTRFNKLFSDKEVKFKRYNKNGANFEWVDGTIYSILKNPIYKGKRQHKGETFNIEAIIDEATFDKVQEVLKSKFNMKDINRKYLNIFKEKIICGTCGRTYFLHKRADNSESAYKCLSKRYNHNCGNPSISIDKLNNAVFNMVAMLMIRYARSNKQKYLDLIELEKNNVQIQLDNNILAFEKISKQEMNLAQLRIKDMISIENYTLSYDNILAEKSLLVDKIKDLRNEKEKIENQIETLKTDKIEARDVNLFKEYISLYVDYVKIEELPRESFPFIESEYENKQDIIIMVTLKLVYDEFLYKSVISQRSKWQILFKRVENEPEYRNPIPLDKILVGHKIKI